MFIKVAGLVLVALACSPAQVGITPEQPRAGEPFTVIYDPSAPAASLKSTDPVWASLTIYFEDHTERHDAGAMSRLPNGHLQYESTVPNGACLIQIAIATLHDYDAKATAEVLVLRPDGKTARGGNDHLMWSHSADAERYFRREIERYPDNFAAYRHRWFLADAKEQEIAMIRRDLPTILEGESQSPAERLYALSYAYWRLADQEHARDSVRQMIRRFPESPLTDDALNYYIFRSNGETKTEALQWERDLVANHPASPHARSAITGLAADPQFPFAAVKAVANEQLRVGVTADPTLYLALASASLAHRVDYDQALTELEKALDLLLTGRFRIRFDPAGTLTQRRLADAYRLRAEIHLAQNASADAVADVRASEAFERANIAASHLVEARIWSSLSDWPRAETALLEAWRRDPVAGEPLLRDVFARNRGSDNGFPAFLDANRVVSMTAGRPKRAPSFAAVSLDGRNWSLPELRGKMVVLNFWFIGCLPCRQEIPLLNPLVETYPEFVFLAFALDDEAQLREFTAKTPFRYAIVPSAQKTADTFGVAAYPTHIVINSAGEVVFETNEDLDGLRATLARQRK